MRALQKQVNRNRKTDSTQFQKGWSVLLSDMKYLFPYSNYILKRDRESCKMFKMFFFLLNMDNLATKVFVEETSLSLIFKNPKLHNQ